MTNARHKGRASEGLVFVGLDVGTDGTAVVGCVRSKEDPTFSAPIPLDFSNDETGTSTLSKDKSAILYSKVKGGKPLLYGRAAIDKCVGDPLKEMCLVRSFKLHAKDTSPEWAVMDEDGVLLTKERVLGDWLNHIIPSVRKHFRDARPELRNSDFVWAATVPARSADGMRETYKRLLHQAIGQDARLHIISEPIAAMLHCNKFVIANSEKPMWDSPDPVLVVDVGGGTLDLTVFQWSEDKTAKQLVADDGSFDAGRQVDEFMVQCIIQRVGGAEVWRRFLGLEKAPPPDMPSIEFTYLEMLQSWEKWKFAFTGVEDARLTLPTALEYAMTKGGTFDQFAASQGNARRTIRLSADDVKSCFDRVIEPICDRIDSIVLPGPGNSKRAVQKFLTGGLAGNRYFQAMMKERYKFTLYDGLYTKDLAVVLGALEYAKDPGCIKNRILRRTYGICLWLPIDDFPSPAAIRSQIKQQATRASKRRRLSRAGKNKKKVRFSDSTGELGGDLDSDSHRDQHEEGDGEEAREETGTVSDGNSEEEESDIGVKEFSYVGKGRKRIRVQHVYAFVPYAKMGDEILLGKDITATSNEVVPNPENKREVTVYVASCLMVVNEITPWDAIPNEMKDGHTAFSLPALTAGTKMTVALQFDVLDVRVKLRTPEDRSDQDYGVDGGT